MNKVNLENNETLDSFMSCLTDGVVVHDTDARIINFNQKALKILQLSEDQLLGKTPTDPQWKMVKEDGSEFTHAENPALVTLKTGQPVFNAIMGIETKESLMTWLQINSMPLVQESSTYAIVVFRDITDEHIKKIQTNLALQSSGIGIWKFNIQKNILEWDDSLYELYEVKREDFTGDYEAWEKTVLPEDKEAAVEELNKAIQGLKQSSTIFRIVTPGGKIKYIEARAEIINDALGEPLLVVGTNWDVTDKMERQQALEEAKENAIKFALAKSSFLVTMSHEIRTPMNGVIGMTELLLETPLDSEQQEMLETVYNSGNNLMNIINDILDFSAIEAGKLRIVPREFNLHTELEEIVALFKASATKKSITLNLAIKNDVPLFVKADSSRIRQIISNFLNNAIKFSGDGTTVSLDVSRQSGNKVKFSVKDEGDGLTKAEQKRIFEEFIQLDNGFNRKHGGTGLGLAICLNIAKLMGGEILVNSKKGDGAEFSLLLGIKEIATEHSINSSAKSPDKLSVDHPHSILVVEDNRVNQKTILKMLEKNGYNADLACNGLEAVNMCNGKDYSLIFMDLQMPIMDGFEATEKILSSKPDSKIVALTANIMKEDRDKCKEIGMCGFVGKPFSKVQLIEAITSLKS